METTPRKPWRPSITGLLLVTALLIAAGAACATRYHFVQVNGAMIARGDRWTGEVVFVNVYGKVVGRQP